MPLPSESYMKLVGGLNSVNSTIYTNNLIKIGDTVKISGTSANNGVFTVTDVVSTGSTGEGVGTDFTDDTRSGDITSGTTMIMDSANTSLVAGLSVSGTNIQSDTYILSVTQTSNPATFEMSKSVGGTVSGGTTLTFADMDIYYILKGGILTNESSAGSTDPQIEVVRAPGDKLIALGDVDSAAGIDIWSNNATTDYIGTSPASADGWEASAINPTLSGNDAKYIYHFADEALRVCNINEQNKSLIKWYGYIQRHQFNSVNGLIFSEWQEHPNILESPKLATSFTYVYGTTSHDGSVATNYYKNNRGIVKAKRAGEDADLEGSIEDIQLNGSHNATTTSFTFENNNATANILDQSNVGEVITIDETLGTFPLEFLFCKKESGSGGDPITYSRAYGGALVGTAPDTYSDQDTPILERGLGFNIAVSDGTGDGDWEEGTYEFYQSFIYDGNQESLPFQMGNGSATIEAFTHDAAGGKSLQISIFADVAYNGRITGGRVYTRLSATDDDLSLVLDIDIVKGVRTFLDADHVPWSLNSFTDETCDYNHTAGAPRVVAHDANPNIINGLFVSGDGIAATIASIDSATQFTISADATATNTNETLTFTNGNGYYVLGDGVGNLTSPNLDTYTTINGFSPDVNFVAIGGIGELYKVSVVANRRSFIANVRMKGKGGAVEKFGDRIMFSEIGKFDTFLEHNFIDVSKGDYGEYTALESYADRLLAFKHNLVHIINISSPSVSNWYLEDTVKYFGVNFPFSVAKTKNGIVWVSDDGCYLYDGKIVRNLIDRKIAVSRASFTSIDRTWNDWYRGTAHIKDVMLGYDPISNSLIMVRSPNDSTNLSNQAFVYDFDSNGWTYNDNIFSDSETYTNFVTDWNNNLMLGYQNSGEVTFQKYLPIGIAQQNQRFFTKDIDFGQPGLIKKIYKIIVTYKSDTALSTPFQYAINGTQSFSSFTGDFIDTSSVWDIVTLTTSSPISCQSIQIKCNAFTASTGIFEINDIAIQYRVIRNKEST